jgi:lipopolysaccharide/colanic/teichoic acid biosynthesis glycosyltransferase
LALLAVPVIAGLALVMACSLRCSPFFVQQRVGRDGRSFRFWKLRTLPKAAPAYADKYAIEQIPIPRVARFLRATHLDELPQLFLVPLGRMSLVGPRPEMPQLHRDGDEAFARARTSVRPGCTGLWQVSAAYHRLIWEAPEYDLAYLRLASLRLDLWILWRTLAMTLGWAGPVTLDDLPRWAGRRDAGAPTGVVPAEVGSMRGAGSCA